MLGRRKTKPLKWIKRKTENDKLDPNKIKGLVNTKHENYESYFSNSAAIWSHWATEGFQIQWCSWGGVKSWTKGAMMTKTVSHFSQLQEINTLNLLSWPLYFSIHHFTCFLFYKWVSVHGLDRMVMSHNNDNHKRRLYKETHVCSLLFKRPA